MNLNYILGNMEKKELNRLELEFLSAIDWNIYVSQDDYEKTTDNLEWSVAVKEIDKRPGKWTTYSDLCVLSKSMELIKVWGTLYEYTIKVTAVCAFAYAASLMTMIGTCHLLSKTQIFNPQSMQNSLQNLYMKNKKSGIKIRTNQTELILDSTTQGLENNDPEEDIEALNDKLRIDFNQWNNESKAELFNKDDNDMTHFCQFDHRNQDLNMLREDVIMNRLTRALFALKIGSFRDLMLGPQSFSGMGHV